MARPRNSSLPDEGGQPSRISEVVRYREATDADGVTNMVPFTLGEQIVERVRTGLDLTDAAASANITKQTIWNWRRRGALNRALVAQGKPLATDDGDAYVKFVDALERAEAEAELVRLAIIQRAAEGGFKTTRETIKYDAAGDVLERTVVTEVSLPQWTAAAWYLERRHARKYGRKSQLAAEALSGLLHAHDDGDDEALRTEALIAMAQEFGT